MSRKVVSPACILNFPYLREVDTYNKQSPVYSVQGLFKQNFRVIDSIVNDRSIQKGMVNITL